APVPRTRQSPQVGGGHGGGTFDGRIEDDVAVGAQGARVAGALNLGAGVLATVGDGVRGGRAGPGVRLRNSQNRPARTERRPVRYWRQGQEIPGDPESPHAPRPAIRPCVHVPCASGETPSWINLDNADQKAAVPRRLRWLYRPNRRRSYNCGISREPPC